MAVCPAHKVSHFISCRAQPLRALRANPVFRADEKHIRAKNRVIDKTQGSAGVLSKIADCTRMRFSSACNR
jgi:hypothetical protein